MHSMHFMIKFAYFLFLVYTSILVNQSMIGTHANLVIDS